ncbi:glycosyl hydrolase family 28-related protein [Sphingomonas sp. CD22]|uniref:glycosyl hydrolase family 28-related protein n=1 Tax=Sphingomonas sp. CD22 TaxID=3100214 RepID=UPI002ADF7453|nr:glycosyl hydrolase family 28-related protein [Sphingomonas sp. CD22]MEA1085875.1 glycosyl hydrolase family 28-related protein [Sphingomonas sp. CD22]
MVQKVGKNAGGTRRRDLLVAGGISTVALIGPSCASPTPTAASASALPGASPRAFGAIGDGAFHPLSSRFKTLQEARAVYPFAERLDQSLDWAGIQAAIDSVETAAGTITIPTGHFVISDSIRLPSHVTLRGESRNGSVIDNQYHPLDAPQIVNKDPVAFLYATIRDLTLNGGSHAIKVRATREVAGIVIEAITSNLQREGNITFSSMQTTVIRDCHLMDGATGISVEGFPCNSVHLINTRLGRHSDASVRLRGADGFMMIGGSMEAGGVAGRATIDVETGGAYANAIHFQNVYFENTHQHLLRSRGARTISFSGCKMTGTGAAGRGMAAYGFDCDADLIVLAGNHFDYPTIAPANALLQGDNANLVATGTRWRERAGSRVALLSRRFSRDEAGARLFTVSLDGAGRASGQITLLLDGGAQQTIKRITLPLDIAVDRTGATTWRIGADPMVAARVTPATNGAAVAVTVSAAQTSLRFDLALDGLDAAALRVEVA